MLYCLFHTGSKPNKVTKPSSPDNPNNPTQPKDTDPSKEEADTDTEDSDSSSEENTEDTKDSGKEGDAVPDICNDPSIDTITMMKNGTVYAFRHNHYMKLDVGGFGIKPGYPRSISLDWEGIDGPIDAALTLPPLFRFDYNFTAKKHVKIEIRKERMYLFQGSLVYRYEGGSQGLSAGYPMKTSDCFPGLPGGIDAAFTWSGNGKIYFIKGEY